jgi:hypothetical protein
MNSTLISISDHPKFAAIKRKIQLQPLTIDYAEQVANWPFQVVHYDEAGDELLEVPRANGNFLISNESIVDSTTGVKIPIDADEETLAAGVPEFEFLRGMLLLPEVDPLTLIVVRVAITDSRQNFDSYTGLMGL